MDKYDDDVAPSKLPLILAGIATIILVIVAIVGVIWIKGRRVENQNTTSTTEETGSVVVNHTMAPSESIYSGNQDTVSLKKDAYPEINQLVTDYYKAVLTRDVDLLNQIVSSDHKLTENDISKSGEYIECYQNVACYTVEGMDANTYIVYVKSDIKLVNIDTAAPSLERMFVKRNEDGSVCICSGGISDEMTSYAQKMDNQEDVRILLKEVNKDFRDACSSDEELNEFYNKILNDFKENE